MVIKIIKKKCKFCKKEFIAEKKMNLCHSCYFEYLKLKIIKGENSEIKN